VPQQEVTDRALELSSFCVHENPCCSLTPT
jgi:hypothetical protein